MTAEEMLYRAEVGYDTITGHTAAGITKKEWSLFLTEAQMDVILVHLPVKPADISFEKTELISEQFSDLVSDSVNISDGTLTTARSANQYGGVSGISTFYDLPDDFLYGLYSEITYADDSECDKEIDTKVSNVWTDASTYVYGSAVTTILIDTGSTGQDFLDYVAAHPNNKSDRVIGLVPGSSSHVFYYEPTIVKSKIKVKPVSHNYYTINIKNPYKKPSSTLAWRIVAKDLDNKIRHEIVASAPPKDYILRYLRKPAPIIIFSPDYDGDNDTIQGINLNDVFTGGVSLNPEMNDSISDNIIRRAITRAQTALGDVQAVQINSAVNATLN